MNTSLRNAVVYLALIGAAVLSTHAWQDKGPDNGDEAEKRRDIEARTVDLVKPGDEQNEGEHNFLGAKTSTGEFKGRKYRQAQPGGWFSWDLKIMTGEPQQLVITYWGSETNRQFDILVNDRPFRTEQTIASHPETFYDEIYTLSGDETRMRQSITVKFEGKDKAVGGVYGVRVLKFGRR